MGKRILLTLLLLTGLVMAQPTELRVFQLSNRSAASAVEAVRALLGPGGTALPDEQTNKLIVKDTPENLAQIEKLLQAIDVAAPQVMITVDFTGNSSGSGSVLSGGYSDPGGPSVVASGRETRESSRGQQKLMVLSGEEGHLVIGRQLTYVQPYWTLSQQFGLLPPGVIFQNVTTGFSVKPRVVGDVVTMEIAPWLSYESDRGRGQVTFSEAATTVRVRSGDSLAVAAGSQSGSRRAGGVSGGASGTGAELDAWSLMLGRSAGASERSAGFVITPVIIPDWSKDSP